MTLVCFLTVLVIFAWIERDRERASEGTGLEIGEMYANGCELEGDETFEGLNLKYRYACDESERHLFDEAEIRRRFAAAHTLKIESVVSSVERARDGAADVAAARSPEEKLKAWGVATGTVIGDSHIEKLHELESEVGQ